MKNLFILFAILLISCGQSAKEKANEIQRITLLIEKTKTEHYNAAMELSKSEEELKYWKAQLEVERANLSKVKEFQFMRTQSEKEEQIRNQSLKVQEAEDAIQNLHNSVSNGKETVTIWEDSIQRLEKTGRLLLQ